MKFDLPPVVVDTIVRALRKRKWEESNDSLQLFLAQAQDAKLQAAVLVPEQELNALRAAAQAAQNAAQTEQQTKTPAPADTPLPASKTK